jgi:hypothetical protein
MAVDVALAVNSYSNGVGYFSPFGPNAKLRSPGRVGGFLEMWAVLLVALAIAGAGVAFLLLLSWVDQPEK